MQNSSKKHIAKRKEQSGKKGDVRALGVRLKVKGKGCYPLITQI